MGYTVNIFLDFSVTSTWPAIRLSLLLTFAVRERLHGRSKLPRHVGRPHVLAQFHGPLVRLRTIYELGPGTKSRQGITVARFQHRFRQQHLVGRLFEELKQ